MNALRSRLSVTSCMLLCVVCLTPQLSAKPSGTSFPGYPDTVVATIPTGGWPHGPAATLDGKYIYVPGFSSDSVYVVRTTDNAVVAGFPLAGRPTIALPSPDGQYMYISNSGNGTVARVRLTDNAIVHQTGMLSDPFAMAFVQNNQGMYVDIFRSPENRVAVLRTSDDSLLQYITVGFDPWGIAATADGRHCYVSSAYSDTVYVLRTSDNTVESTIPVEGNPHGIALSPAEDLLYVACKYSPDLQAPDDSPATISSRQQTHAAHQGNQCLKVIRLSDQSVVATVPLADPPGFLALLPNGKYLYISSYGFNHVTIIRTADFSVVKTVTTGYASSGLAVLPDGSAVYVSAMDEGCVRVIGNVDVGPVAILSPAGTVDSGSACAPRAVVRNFGPTSVTFPLTMDIAAGYTQTVQETLPARQADTVVFPAWAARPVGSLAVTCFTSLAGDEDRTNDTIRDTVLVRRVLNLDVGPVAILSPAGTPESGKVYVPRAIVRNFGLTAATFPVTMAIGGSYDQTTSETLAAGAADTVSFSSWTALPNGITPLTCFTALAGDQDPTNDTIRDTVTVVGPPTDDVGATAILSPAGHVHAGDTVIPKARIRNFGNRTARYFGVQFRIGASYNRTVTVTQALLPESTLDLTFPSWVAAAGQWAVSCSTMLMNDVKRANDKVSSSLRVYAQSLVIAPDQSDRLEEGQGKTYRFYALIAGDTGGVVELSSVECRMPNPDCPRIANRQSSIVNYQGWSLRLCDASGANDLTDTDGDGIPDLGYAAPGESCWFSLDVTAAAGLVGDTASLAQRTFQIPGHIGSNPQVADTAVLTLTLVPGFSVHNFPNPFSDHTAFVIGLPEDGNVSLTVYTRAGERVRRVQVPTDMVAGVHVAAWDGTNDNGRAVVPGTYEYVLDYEHDGKTDSVHKKLVRTKE